MLILYNEEFLPVFNRVESVIQIEEFDPGSELTLAAWLRHASRTEYMIE